MLLIQNCYMIDPASVTEGRRDILIDHGRIVKIEKHLMAPQGASVLDAAGMIACPGLIDTHSHFRDPGFTYKEDLISGSEAAVKGGYTSIILMANTKPPVDSPAILDDILGRGRDLPVHLYSCANVTRGMAGKELCDLRTLAECGAAGFTDDGLPIMDGALLKEALQTSLQTVQIKQVTASPTIQQESFDFDPKPMPIIENNQPVVQPSSSMIEKGFESYQKVESQPIKVQENVVETYPQPKEEGQEKGPTFFDHLKVLAQLRDSYILCSNPEGLVIIDQHAAQERYHYEQIQEIVSQPCTQTQPLMIPLQVDVSSDVMAMLEDINQHTDYYGLHFEPFGNDQVVLREEPFWFQDVEKINFIQDLFDYFRQYRQVDVLALRKKVISCISAYKPT